MAMKTLALTLALSLLPALAAAQTPPRAVAPRSTVHRGEWIPVDGRVARPYFWVQSRSAPHYQPPEARRSFAPTVVRAVRRDPF